MLPRPDCVFAIPSLHDGLELDGRLYFPRRISGEQAVSVRGFVAFAHPYAPLGGSWDDPIVHSVGSTLLTSGFALITFNFRGAGKSCGNTSWTGNAEVADFVSFYALSLLIINAPGVLDHIALVPSATLEARPVLILGGYSYGSVIATCLPDLGTLVSSLATPKEGSFEYEIATRALELSKALLGYLESQSHLAWASTAAIDVEPVASPSRSLAFGGYGSEEAGRRISRESLTRSFDVDGIRRNVAKAKRRLTGTDRGDTRNHRDNAHGAGVPQVQVLPLIANLLVSPLLPPISGFITLFTRPSYQAKATPKSSMAHDQQTNLCNNTTLAIYGDGDVFTSVRKLRKWSQSLQSLPNSKFLYQEIPGAGHFWRESDAESQLSIGISRWLQVFVVSQSTPQVNR